MSEVTRLYPRSLCSSRLDVTIMFEHTVRYEYTSPGYRTIITCKCPVGESCLGPVFRPFTNLEDTLMSDGYLHIFLTK